jgi:hypothetical protein
MITLTRFAHASRRGIVVIALLLTLWLAGAGEAWAKGRKAPQAEEKGPTGKGYVVPYGIVMMAVALGLITVCRQGRRADEPKKPEPK